MNIDIHKHVDYWIGSSLEDIESAELLITSRKFRHGMFFAHLALEKTLKAHICKNKQTMAPRIHNLLRLSEQSGINFNDYQLHFLARFDQYQLEGRYPDILQFTADESVLLKQFQIAREFHTWLISQL